MILDGESLVALTEQLAAELSGTAAPKAGAIFQYIDYATWRNELLELPENVGMRNYWQRTLAGSRSAAVGIERTPPAQPARQSAVLPERTFEALRGLALALDMALSDVLTAAWAVFLARRATAEDVLLDRRFDGRFHTELAGAIGRYAQHLPVRISCRDETTITEVLVRVAADTRSAAAHQDYAEIDRIDAGTVVGTYPALSEFSVFEIPAPCSGSMIALEDVDECDGRLASAMAIVAGANQCQCRLTFDPQRMPGAAADRFLDSWLTFLADVVARPHARVGDLALCGAEERKWLLRL